MWDLPDQDKFDPLAKLTLSFSEAKEATACRVAFYLSEWVREEDSLQFCCSQLLVERAMRKSSEQRGLCGMALLFPILSVWAVRVDLPFAHLLWKGRASSRKFSVCVKTRVAEKGQCRWC